MSDATAVSTGATPGAMDAAQAAPAPGTEVADEWKPEPRQWTWKDLFTAPMLAFKPKCMLVSAIAVILIGLWYRLFNDSIGPNLNPFVANVLDWAWNTVALVIFSLAATLVAVFMKADLLDDEFLSLKEALAQYRSRLLPAILVPLFLMGLIAGFHMLMALPILIGAIPIVGPALYAIFYPLGFLLGLFITLLTIAVVLSVFVFPSIVAIRKHGWFDNVVDTFEAVGTKPHILVGSLLLVWVLIGVSHYIGFGGMDRLRETGVVMPGDALPQTEARANTVREAVLEYARVGPFGQIRQYYSHVAANLAPANYDGVRPHLVGTSGRPAAKEPSAFYLICGTITGLWQVLIGALILGYCMNLFVGGGMLTYLVVREDDYWDDEDLEDLDQLAKELEAEAKQDAAKAPVGGPAPTSAATPPATAAPATPLAGGTATTGAQPGKGGDPVVSPAAPAAPAAPKPPIAS